MGSWSPVLQAGRLVDTQVFPPPVSFIYLPALPTSTPTGRSHWDSELGATPIRSEEELCAPPLGRRHQKAWHCDP